MSGLYSPEAEARMAELKRKEATGEPVLWSDIFGVLEPATQPTDSERCRCCGSDARVEYGGSGAHCALCVDRGHAGGAA